MGATALNDFTPYSFPTSGAFFLYHVSLFDSVTREEIVNLNHASLEGTSCGLHSMDCEYQRRACRTGDRCMNFGFLSDCYDTLMYEKTTLAPLTGPVTSDAHWADSTYERAPELNPFHPTYGHLLTGAGYYEPTRLNGAPSPPGISYRSLFEVQQPELQPVMSATELHAWRMEMIAHDDWIEDVVDMDVLNGGAGRWTPHKLVQLLEYYENNGAPIDPRYGYLGQRRQPRALHSVPHAHPPPLIPPIAPSAPPGAHAFYAPDGVMPPGWEAVPFWGGDAYQPWQQPVYDAWADQGAARVWTAAAWASALHTVLHGIVDRRDVHAHVVRDVVQFMVDVNASTQQAVLEAIDNAYFGAALGAASHTAVAGMSPRHTVYHSHGLIPTSMS